MANVTMDQMLAKTEEIKKLLAEAGSDPSNIDKVTEVAKRAEAAGRELEAMGKAYIEQNRAADAGKRGFIEVVLTPEQRKNVQQKTGVFMESLLIQDDEGIEALGMPTQDPRIIEVRAIQEAQRRNQAAQAEAQSKREFEHAIAELEAQGQAELNAEIAKLRNDPVFGPMFKK
jgi:hypothetical protein